VASALQPSELAPGLLLGEDVELEEGVAIGANVVIHAGSVIGPVATIQDNAVIGKAALVGPRSSAPREATAGAIIGPGAAVLCGAIVFAGARLAEGAIAGDQCQVRERSVVGENSVVGRGCAIDNDVAIGRGVRIETGCYITGHSIVEDEVFMGPGVVTTNDNTMARMAPETPLPAPRLHRACRVGGGAVLCPGIEVGEEAFIAAGAVIVRDVPPRAVVMGVPARQVGWVPDEDLIEHWS
jgi:UDP-3-O-[3-hydroxymyristoyl] glucosamine N-acyltransferase